MFLGLEFNIVDDPLFPSLFCSLWDKWEQSESSQVYYHGASIIEVNVDITTGREIS